MQKTSNIPMPETFTALCAKHYTSFAIPDTKGNKPTMSNKGNGYRVDDHK